MCHHAEVANCHLLNADLNVGRMHMEHKKSGIAAFTRSDSGLMIFVMTNACWLVLNKEPTKWIDSTEMELEELSMEVEEDPGMMDEVYDEDRFVDKAELLDECEHVATDFDSVMTVTWLNLS
ncbi:uncharacterized protein HD556DRAFT_1302269 [Suillus plorans]|uniref:Uncharacterized protein n=1 Tax=Suillus plorans TaxID=116603 RepID=A0A9P7E2W3_9AGAM|nr:uncharacterized protein HD556DRAFT_1302269 [Suillus plorans]KAG1809846.1 hypothetical protein HD556DRAFT_1302269 [Suillus plorans]